MARADRSAALRAAAPHPVPPSTLPTRANPPKSGISAGLPMSASGPRPMDLWPGLEPGPVGSGRRGGTVKAVVYEAPRQVSVKDVPDARIERPTDVLVQITSANIC